MDNLNKRWEEFLSDIQPQVPAISYDMWLKKLEPINIIDGVFYIKANNQNDILNSLDKAEKPCIINV